MKSIKINNEKLSFEQVLEMFHEATRKLAEYKELEMSLRKTIVDNYFDSENLEGTENLDLGEGYKLKCVKKLNRSFVTKEESEIEKVLDKLPDEISSRIIKYKPELSVSEYKKLDDKNRKIFDKLIVTKEASPSLEIVAPKTK